MSSLRRAALRPLGLMAVLVGAVWLLWVPAAGAQETPRVWFVSATSEHHEHDNGNIVETFTATNGQGKVFEYRLTEHEVELAVDPVPTQDIYVRFRYRGTAEWFRWSNRLVSLGDVTGPINIGSPSYTKTITASLYEALPWEGDYYVAHDGPPNRRCVYITHEEHLNCGAVNGRVWTAFKIPAGTSRHTLKIRVVDDDIHDSGETVVLELGQGWHRELVRGTNLGAPTGNEYRGCWRRIIRVMGVDSYSEWVWDQNHCHESVPHRVTGTGYTLGPHPTHTLTILNDEPPPEPEPEQEAWVPPPPDLDAPAPAKASAEVLWDRSVLVGWPSAAGVSKYHVRARSGNGHGTRWGYNQTGNWYVFGGLQTGTWVIEVYNAGNWSPVTGWLIVKMPEKGQEPAPPEPPDQPEQPKQTPPPQTPTVSIAGGSGVTEGGVALFTVTASPAPSSPLSVSLSVSQSGDYTGTTGSRTVTVPTGGTATYSVVTVDDSVDEVDGSVTVTLSGGSGYTVGSSSSATVAVADNDDPPVVTPTVSIAGGSGVTEGGVALFTVTASPAPTTPLTVLLSVSQSGDYTVLGTTGTRTVTIPTGGTANVSIATLDDSADEADGSVTVTLSAGSGYTVGSSSSATVAVADNDDPPVVTPAVSIAAGSGVTEGGVASFTVTASPAPTTELTVTVDVSQSGDYTATTGTRTVTVPTGGTATYSVVTVDDSADEADGSVTVTLSAGNGYTVGSSSSATVAVADNDDPPVPATPSVCVTTDTALLSQVEAKVTRHANETGRTDLHEMFSRSLNTMKGVDTYTTAALKARPDKQGAKWQGAGPNPMWQAVYAELDRLETCRAAQ